MNMFYVKATLILLLASLAACTNVCPAPTLRLYAEMQAAPGDGLAASQASDFERALMLAADHER